MTAIWMAIAFLAMGERPAETRWACANTIEVWCAADGCAAKDASETTPLAVSARADGRFSVCAYTGCWEATAAPLAAQGRWLWTADRVPFSTSDAFVADLSILIHEKDGIGFVRAGSIATPVICQQRPN